MKKIAIVMASFLLAGCQSISTSVSRFNAMETAAPKRFRVLASEQSLEARTYAQTISQQLTKLGWQNVTSGSEVDVRFFFSIDGGRTESTTMPLYGQTGGGTTFSSGTIYSGGRVGSYTGTSYSAPTYGVVGAIPVSTTVFKRELKLTMTDVRRNKQIFEGTVTSQGTTGTIPPVANCLIEAMFKEFPGTSGSTVQYNLPYEGCRPK